MTIQWLGGEKPSTPEASYLVMFDDMTARSTRCKRTLRFYRESLNIIIKNLKLLNRHTLPWEITTDDVIALMNFWKDRGLMISTRRGYVSALRTWTRYWKNPVFESMEISWPADTRPTVDWLTDEEARKLASMELPPMQELIIHCELCLGMRRVELIRSKVSDWTDTFVDILGKGPQGGKPRRMPYHPDTKAILDRYLGYRRQIVAFGKIKDPSVEDPEYLLIYLKGSYLLPYSPKGTGIDELLKPAQANLGKPFSNHTLRRTFGRMMYRSGVEVATISRMLGHESTDTTLKYIGVNLDDMAEAMKLYNVKR